MSLPSGKSPSKKKLLEISITNKLVRELKKLPLIYVRKNVAVSIRGIPDVEGCYKGLFFALEVKRSKREVYDALGNSRVVGRARLQEFVMTEMRIAGAYTSFVFPENLEEVIAELKEAADKLRNLP